MVQTPQQRKANQKFAKDLNKKMGKPVQEVKKRQDLKSPVPTWVLAVLGFVVFGGLLFEILSRFFL